MYTDNTQGKNQITQLSFKHFIFCCRTRGNEWQATEMKTRYKIQTRKGSSKSQSNINYESVVHTLTKIILKIHHLLHFQVTFEIGQGHKDILEQKNYKCCWICFPTLPSSKMKVYHEWRLRLSLKRWWLQLHPHMTLTVASHAKVNPSGSSLTIKYCLWQKPPPPSPIPFKTTFLKWDNTLHASDQWTLSPSLRHRVMFVTKCFSSVCN